VLKYDHTGQRFGRLLVLDRQGRNWRCICDCGIIKILGGGNLRLGTTNSCGCLFRETLIARNTKHGLCKEHWKAYQAWFDAIKRCTDPENESFSNYGGRGIMVCIRWLNSFPLFLEDMGDPPKGMTLDRKNNNKGYSKRNCQWVTRRDNINNRRNTKYVVYEGVSQPLSILAESFNISRKALYCRLLRGWPIEVALTTPTTDKFLRKSARREAA
jgi:hypothetical protein